MLTDAHHVGVWGLTTRTLKVTLRPAGVTNVTVERVPSRCALRGETVPEPRAVAAAPAAAITRTAAAAATRRTLGRVVANTDRLPHLAQSRDDRRSTGTVTTGRRESRELLAEPAVVPDRMDAPVVGATLAELGEVIPPRLILTEREATQPDAVDRRIRVDVAGVRDRVRRVGAQGLV